MSELDDILKGDSLLFHQRLNLIKNEISGEVKPNGPISRDHFRTNMNGVSLDQMEKMVQKSSTKIDRNHETFMKTNFGETNPF